MRALRTWPVLTALLTASCATGGMTRHDVSRQLQQRTGAALRPQNSDTSFSRPPGVSETDGLTEQEAVALALWNNGAFQADLAQVDVSRADLAEAALLPNPFLSVVFPLGPRQLAAYVNLPLEFLWQRPRRIETAERDLARVATGLVQNGLDVVRDVRLSFVDAQVSRERERALREGARLLGELRGIARVRLAAGDVGAADVEAIEADVAAFEARAAQAVADREAARARLGRLTGLGAGVPEELPALSTEPSEALPDGDGLRREAFAARPDLRAAELGVEAATARIGWERSRAWAFMAVLDGGTSAGQAFGVSPGFRAEIPLFSRNQGGIGRAEAELQRASWRYVAVRQQIVAELATAVSAHAQATAVLRLASEREVPAAERLVALARSNFESGELAWFAVLDAQRRLLDARLRALDAAAALQRARVEVERSVGGPVHARR